MAKCANRECALALTATNRSKDNPSYCAACGQFVHAFRPNAALPDEWFEVSTGPPVAGDRVQGSQCRECGLGEFVIVPLGRYTFGAQCVDQLSDGVTLQGCGTVHPVRSKMGCEVIRSSEPVA